LTGAEAEGSTIPEAVPVEGLAPVTQEAAKAAPEPAEVASGGAPAMTEEERDNILPESNLEVVVRSLEIQDAEPIHSASMSGTATTSRGGIELVADNLVDPAANGKVVAHKVGKMKEERGWNQPIWVPKEVIINMKGPQMVWVPKATSRPLE
jgi:hypothetical protein